MGDSGGVSRTSGFGPFAHQSSARDGQGRFPEWGLPGSSSPEPSPEHRHTPYAGYWDFGPGASK
jgi:hypothetical protein